MNIRQKILTAVLCTPSALMGLLALILIAAGSSSTSPEAKAPSQEPEPVLEQPERTEEEQPETTADIISGIISDLSIKCSNINVICSDDKSSRISYHYDSPVWDASGLISSCLTDYVNICKRAYNIDGFSNISLFVFGDMTDNEGNTSSEKIFAICIDKLSFSEFSWDDIAFLPGSYETIQSSCEMFDIHAGITNSVDYSKVYYKGE